MTPSLFCSTHLFLPVSRLCPLKVPCSLRYVHQIYSVLRNRFLDLSTFDLHFESANPKILTFYADYRYTDITLTEHCNLIVIRLGHHTPLQYATLYDKSQPSLVGVLDLDYVLLLQSDLVIRHASF
jgi:hypothetical protein